MSNTQEDSKYEDGKWMGLEEIEKKDDSPHLNVNFFSDFTQLRFVKLISFKKDEE